LRRKRAVFGPNASPSDFGRPFSDIISRLDDRERAGPEEHLTVVTSARLGRRTFLVAAGSGVAALVVPTVFRAPALVRAEPADRSINARVLIRRGDSSVDAGSITVSGDGEFAVTDGQGDLVMKASAQRKVTVGREGDAFWVKEGDGERKTGLPGPIRFNGTGDGAPLRNQSTSSGDPTPYRGTLEVTASPDDRVALVNVLGLEEYLYGVVTKELPALFGPEPLKAQAVAARTYTLARRAVAPHKAQSADVCDTQHCQAYGGLSGEHAAGRAAVDATRGRVLFQSGAVFEPYYSSACGGHTEAAGRIFGTADQRDGDAVPDGEVPGGIKLTTDDGAMRFLKSSWDSNCARSDRYRWSYTWDADQLKAIVASGIQRYQGTQTVDASAADARVEQIENVTIPERGASGRAMSIRFEAPGVSWTVRRDWGIRNFLRVPSGELLPSSAVALEIERDAEKKVTKLTAFGAGWGHGAGLCQYGTRGLAARGLEYDAILDHYYPTAELGDAPVSFRDPDFSQPARANANQRPSTPAPDAPAPALTQPPQPSPEASPVRTLFTTTTPSILGR
jgi:stage II sporulation protein D